MNIDKDTYWFKHDLEPTSDPKIQALISVYGAVGYGLYWRIVEMLHSDNNHCIPLKKYIYIAIAKQMLQTVDFIEKFIPDCVSDFELFYIDNEQLMCKRVFKNIEKRQQIKEKRREAGRKGGEANAKQLLSKVEANAKQNEAEEKRGEEIRDNNTNVLLLPKNEDFIKFVEWQKINTPSLLNMKKPFSEDEFLKLKKKYHYTTIIDMCERMYNNPNITKKYVSAYLTLTKWIKRNETSHS